MNYLLIFVAFYLNISLAQSIITGQVEDYTGGEANLVGYTFEGNTFIGSGQLKADTSFEFILPTGLPENIEALSFDSLWCSDFRVSPANAKGKFVYVLGTTEDTEKSGGLVLASSLAAAQQMLNDTREQPATPYALASWLYVDSDISISGTCETNIPQKIDLELKQGWTMIVTEVNNGVATILTEPTMELKWFWLEPPSN